MDSPEPGIELLLQEVGRKVQEAHPRVGCGLVGCLHNDYLRDVPLLLARIDRLRAALTIVSEQGSVLPGSEGARIARSALDEDPSDPTREEIDESRQTA